MNTQTQTRETGGVHMLDQNALLKAILCASPAPTYNEHAEGIKAKNRLHTLKTMKREFLPIEDPKEINQEIKRCEVVVATHKSAVTAEKIGSYGYQILTVDPFTWRNKEGMPLLAPFSLDSNICAVDDRSFSDTFPKCVRPYYEDVLRNLWLAKLKMFWVIGILITLGISIMTAIMFGFEALPAAVIVGSLGAVSFCRDYYRRTRITREGSIGGVIPTEVKQEIKKAMRLGYFKEIFILAEVKQWVSKIVVTPPPDDPLVIGYDGEKFWLITVFDTTSLEQHIADNYAVTTN
jgi:hypothetical protein